MKVKPANKPAPRTIAQAVESFPEIPNAPYFWQPTGNSKLGNMPAYSTAGQTCPDSCAAKRNGCYAESGLTLIPWYRLTAGETPGIDIGQLVGLIKSLPMFSAFRGKVYGDDVHTNGQVNREHLQAIAQAVKARKLSAWTYTHHADSPENIDAFKEATRLGYTVNLSANTQAHADQLHAHGLPLTVILSPDQWDETGKHARTPGGLPIVRCPYETVGIQCRECKLCAVSDRKSIVGFTAHGVQKAKIIRIVKG